MLPCVSISQNTNIPSSITDSIVKNVPDIYRGLKQGEINKRKLRTCLEISNSLNQLIQDQKKEIDEAAKKLSASNSELAKLHDQNSKKAAEIQKLKKTPWYRHPITYLIAGFAGGVFITTK